MERVEPGEEAEGQDTEEDRSGEPSRRSSLSTRASSVSTRFVSFCISSSTAVLMLATTDAIHGGSSGGAPSW